MLKLKNVSKDWKEFRIRDVELEIDKKEYFVLLGPSGAGKTLLLEIIAGIHTPDSGRIYIDGVDVTELPPERRGVGYIPQNYALFPHMTVFENIAFGLKIRKLKNFDEKVRELAKILGIDHLLHRKPKTLSGGEQQRVAIARALAAQPKILLLDEPFSNLDVQIRSKLIEEMRRWRKEFEFTAIHVTHGFEEAFSLADRIGIMLEGRIVQIGKPNEVFLNPKGEDVARFLGFENIFEARSDGTTIRFGDVVLTPRVHVFGRVKVAIRPEDVIVSKSNGCFEAEVESIENLGFTSKITLNLNGLKLRALTVTSRIIEEGIRNGDRVFVSIRDFKLL